MTVLTVLYVTRASRFLRPCISAKILVVLSTDKNKANKNIRAFYKMRQYICVAAPATEHYMKALRGPVRLFSLPRSPLVQ
jgi:hypothetical protein